MTFSLGGNPENSWLGWPSGKTCAFSFSVDDVHPGTSKDCYEAGGDLEKGALGKLNWLVSRHREHRRELAGAGGWQHYALHIAVRASAGGHL